MTLRKYRLVRIIKNYSKTDDTSKHVSSNDKLYVKLVTEFFKIVQRNKSLDNKINITFTLIRFILKDEKITNRICLQLNIPGNLFNVASIFMGFKNEKSLKDLFKILQIEPKLAL